mgnify:FL=1
MLDGLSKLEYRGYDSAGIAVYDGAEIQTEKSKGRLKVLSELTHDGQTMPGTIGSVIPDGQHMVNRQM